ncbi:MAG: hypothetical protein IT558_02060 [Alphaproteobacteria bacterium]|nr:hypothetical protein [Alphaproteobacteria bacterium]
MSYNNELLATMVIGDTLLTCPEGTPEERHLLDCLEMIMGPGGLDVAQDLLNEYLTDPRCLQNAANSWNASGFVDELNKQINNYLLLQERAKNDRRALFLAAADAGSAAEEYLYEL